MLISIVTPAPRRSRAGNRVTALRWARHLRALGHVVEVRSTTDARPPRGDVLIAIHADKSARAVREFHAARPGAPIVVVLGGTDVYGAGFAAPGSDSAESIALASRVVALQPLAVGRIPREARSKARVILQSAPRGAPAPAPRSDRCEAVVIAHLRPVKDPFLAARAVRSLPSDSRVVVVHVGGAADADAAALAEEELRTNPRWEWRGALSRRETLRLLAGGRLAIVPSRSEGGANVVSEAVAASVPILASRVDGNVGLLGDDYPGYFPAGDAGELARLLRRAERDPAFLESLRARVARLAPLFEPRRERASLAALLGELRLGSTVA